MPPVDELSDSGEGGFGGSSGSADGDEDVDDATAAGLFAWLGRHAEQRRGEHAGVHLGTTRLVCANR